MGLSFASKHTGGIPLYTSALCHALKLITIPYEHQNKKCASQICLSVKQNNIK